MWILRMLGTVAALLILLSCTASFAQTPPPNGVPFITQVAPPSLPPTTTAPGNGNFTLTILGANFPSNAVVNLIGPGNYTLHPSSTSVNASGTQITAQFTNAVVASPATLFVTVTNPAGIPPSTSNEYYLPETPAEPSVILNQNLSTFLSGNPQGILAADLSGNGSLDLAVVSQGSNTVSILQSNFTGNFTSGGSYSTGNQPWGIVAADFFGSGPWGLAITNSADNTVTILLPNGGGTFRAGTTISLPGVYPTQIVAADFNGDGKIDLAVLNTCGTGAAGCFPQSAPQGPGTVTILLGNGDGTFTISPAVLTTGNVPFAIAAADLNSDGFIDLVVANSASNNLTLLMGNGDGTFTPASSSPITGNGPSGIAIGDFNEDGNLDLAVTNSTDGTVSILLNQNCSTVAAALCSFAPAPISPAVGANPSAISTGDLNADGFLDLVVANSSTNSVSILLGDGTGAFNAVIPQGQVNFSTGAMPQALVLGDFNQDGRLDIVTSNASGSYTYLRQAAVAQLSLTTSNANPFYGLFVTFTANVIPPFAQATPTGTITFFDGSTPIGTVSLNGYQGYFQYPGLNAGAHQVTAVYSGDSNFISVTSNAVSETVTQAQTTITLTSNVNTLPYLLSFTLTATVQPQNTGTATGTVTFFDTTSSTSLGTISLVNNVAQLTLSKLTPEAHVIVANYQGDANFTGSSSAAYTVNITQSSTTISIASSVNPITLGQATTFTATIQPGTGNTATGSVIFLDGSTPLGSASLTNNSATFTASSLSVATHTITAQYAGDTNFSGSTSAPIPETVNQGSVTVTLTSGLNPSAYNQPVTLSAIVQPMGSTIAPTGTVTFQYLTVLGVSPISNGSAQLTVSTLPVGVDFLTAKYSGDANYSSLVSFYILQNVNPAATTTTVTSGQNPSPFNQAVTFVATMQAAFGGASTGNVTFYDGSTSLGTVTSTNNSAQLTVSSLSGGAHSITARYAGDNNTTASTSAPVTQNVTPAPTTTTITSSVNPSGYGQAVTFVAAWTPSAAGFANGIVSFYQGSTLLSTIPINAAAPQITLSNLPVGTYTLTAQFTPYSSNYAPSTSAPVTQTVNQVATTTSISSSLDPSSFGQNVTFNVSVGSTYYLGSNGGTVTLYDGGTSIGSAIIQGTAVYFPLSTLSTGVHTLTATYSGDSNLTGSTSAPFTQTVSPAATSLTLALNSYATAYGQSVTMTSGVKGVWGGTPTGTITFLDGSTALGTAAMTNGTAQFTISTLTPANHFITAKYNGDANFAGNTSAQANLVVSQATTTTTVSVDINPATYGQTVTLSAGVQTGSGSGPTGTITFLDGSATLGTATISNGAAQLAVSTLGAGSHSITAKYSGDANFAGSTSNALSETVNPASSSTAVVSSANPATYGQGVIFTATVQPSAGSTASGTITFLDGTTSLGTAALANNSAQITVSMLALGAHSITAVYGGSSNLAGSTSLPLAETIIQTPTSITFAANPNPATYGQAVTFVATVQPASGAAVTGTVTFFDGSTTLATATVTNNGSQHNSATLIAAGLQGGAHTITATYSGDSNDLGSTSAALTETVSPAASSISVGSSQNPISYGQSVTFTASVQPSVSGSLASGTVTFFDGSASLGTTNLSSDSALLTVSNLAAGSHSISAKYNGDNNFSASTSAALTQTVNQGSTATTIASNANPAVYGQSVTLTVTVQPPAGTMASGTVTFLDGTTSLGTGAVSNNSAQLAVTGFSLGSHSLTASYSGNTNLSGSSSAVLTQTVNRAGTATVISSNANPSTYGQAVTFTATVQPVAGVPTGTVSFFDGSAQIGSANLSSGVAQVTTTGGALAAGIHTITGKYSGDANFLSSTSGSLAETVNAAATSTVLTTSSNPAPSGHSVTFTATVSSTVAGTQRGTVSFYLDGSTTPTGSAALSSGAAQFSTNSLSAGSHTVVATFASSNSNFQGSSSATLTQEVSDFSISVSPSSLTVARSHSGTYTLTLSSLGDFTGSVSLSCNGVPSHTTCTISPTSVTLNGTSSAQATVTITVSGNANTGQHSLTFKGTSGTFTHSTTATLTIN
jgi:hypothetical protein